MSRRWTIALAQASPCKDPDPVSTLAADVAAVLDDRRSIDMVVYPEIHLCGGCDDAPDGNAWLAAAAEPLTGPRVQALAEIAAEHQVWLVPGSVPELGADGRRYNTAVVFDPTGRLVTSYRKIFPYRPYEGWDCGADFVTFDVPDVGRFGLSICYDSWFPESSRQLAWLGAEVIINVVKTTGPDRAQELVIARANAIMNQLYFLSVNAAGPLGWGGSIYVDPDGEVLAYEEGQHEALTVLDLDLDRVSQIRTVGTAGVTRLWEQLEDGDAPIALPAYEGAMTPGRWNPARHRAPDQGADRPPHAP